MGTTEVELFACERYRVLAGWSASYLLPTDRGAFRVRGSKTSWSKLQEAEKALLGPGWQWEDLHDGEANAVRWQVAPLDCADSEGWTYGTQFASSFEGSAAAGRASIARWQRLVRSQVFVGGVHFLRAVGAPVPVCLNVDLEVAAAAGRLILEGLAAASMRSSWSAPALVSLKQKLLSFLLKQPAGCGSLVRTVQGAIKDFVSAQGGVMAQMADALKGTDETGLTQRIAEVEACFPQLERDSYAAIALRRLCPDCCCSSAQEQHDCRHAPVTCPHVGCTERISAYAVASHDAACKFKLVECPRCKEQVRRGELQAHRKSACPEREAVCAFASVGCTAAIVHREAEAHLEECAQAHLLLTLQALEEEREAGRQLAARVVDLERKAAVSEVALASLGALQVQMVQLAARLEATEKKLAQEEKKSEAAAKRADSAVAALQKDLGTARGDVKKLLQDHGRLAPVVEQHSRSLVASEERIKAIDHALQASGAGPRPGAARA